MGQVDIGDRCVRNIGSSTACPLAGIRKGQGGCRFSRNLMTRTGDKVGK